MYVCTNIAATISRESNVHINTDEVCRSAFSLILGPRNDRVNQIFLANSLSRHKVAEKNTTEQIKILFCTLLTILMSFICI
jgi:hypothetical protein